MRHNIILLCIACGFLACYDDKGNYDYSEMDELTITGIPEEPVAALQKAENLVLSPTVISKFEGEISGDNPNYEFSYYYNKAAGGDYLTPSLLDSAKVKDLDILAAIDPGSYTAWFKVKDLRTGLVTSAEFKIEVSTSTTKGWLVLCEEEGRKARVDMIGEIGNRIAVSRDVLDFMPESHGAIQLYMENNMDATGNPSYLNLYTEESSFRFPFEKGAFSRTNYIDPRVAEFFRKEDGIIVTEYVNKFRFVITAEGDLYRRDHGNFVYDVKINVDVPLTEPTYKMAPFVGATGSGFFYVLYDKTNRTFKYFSRFASSTQCIYSPTEPDADAKKFDWKTGKEMVYMAEAEGKNLTYALMKDAAGQYSICVIGTDWRQITQDSYIEIDAESAPGLANASCYAFHPTLPFLFYDDGENIYRYDMAVRSAKRVLSLPGETISMLKFHKLYNSWNYPAAIAEYQNRLAVGSARTGEGTGSEGSLRFYDVPEFAAELTQSGDTYGGFGVIKDIAYKAR